MDNKEGDSLLKFEPLWSAVDASLWEELGRLKLDELGRSEKPIKMQGFFEANERDGFSSPVQLDSETLLVSEPESVSAVSRSQSLRQSIRGDLVNTNTLDGFKSLDRDALISEHGDALWHKIRSGEALERTSSMQCLTCISFANIKEYTFLHWLAFPAVCLPGQATRIGQVRRLEEELGTEMAKKAVEEYTRRDASLAASVLEFSAEVVSVRPLSCLEKDEALLQKSSWMLAFTDPSGDESNPGWPLRNLLALCVYRLRLQRVRVMAVRAENGTPSTERTRVYEIGLPESDRERDEQLRERPKVVAGWEVNHKGAPGPRLARLSHLKPEQRAHDATALNLKLMRWRQAPDLDTVKLASAKCLLVGMGTLGCSLARSLVAWGVSEMTLVDSGNVSYSNPARQSLYSFDDARASKPKAGAAAEAIRSIDPMCEAKAEQLSVPMPGHVSPEKGVQQAIAEGQRVRDLVDSHDVTFVLTDTREARWLPTAIASAKGKMAFNVALGFDAFAIIRNGGEGAQTEMGCYFCSDVVAPTDSTSGRALDEECTVTRPGLSAIAASLAAEVFASAMQASSEGCPGEERQQSGANPLGECPQTIRGSLREMETMKLRTTRFPKCIACSSAVGEMAENRLDELVKGALEDPVSLERVTGLNELKNDAESALAGMSLEDEEEFE